MPTNDQDPAVLAYAKAYTHADRLFDALEALEELGGITRAATEAGWTPKAMNKALASLRATREAIDRQLEAVEQAERRSPQPTPRPTPTPGQVQRKSLHHAHDEAGPNRGPLARRAAQVRARVDA